MTACTAAWNQKSFRGRNDDGNETTATWKANQSVNWTQAVDQNFRVRFEAQETAGCADNNKVWQLQYNLNAAGWVTVNASSSVVRSSASPNVTDGVSTTNQLTAGTGTFQGGSGTTGGFDEVNGAAGGSTMDVAASGHSECEFCVQIRSADVANNDTVQLRATDNGTAFAAYDATPSITVSELTQYTMNAEPGAFTLTGVNTDDDRALILNAAFGSFTLTGFAADLAKGYTLNAEPGVFALTGLAAEILATRLLNAEPGSFILAGNDAELLRSLVVNAAAGSFVLSGSAAGLTYTPVGGTTSSWLVRARRRARR